MAQTCLSEEEIFDYLNNVEENVDDPVAGGHIYSCSKCRAVFDEIKGIVGAIDRIQTDSEQPEAGDNIGKFKLVKVLGQGGMGKVWKAFDPILERYVAIKVMRENVAVSEEAKQRFLSEAKIVAKMNHVNVVHIYSCGYHEDEMFIVMEFIDGRPLFEPGVDSIRDPRQAIHYFLQTCDGIQAAHEEGIIHRDIKPNNIMIDKKGRIKILDFGIARSFLIDQDLTATGALIGTLKYMAPEVASGKTATRHSDIYSLGLVLYEMLTGIVAFKDLNPLATLDHIKNKDLDKASSHNGKIIPSIDKLIKKMCSKNATDRYDSINGVKEDVKTILLELNSELQAVPTQTAPPNSQLETVNWNQDVDGVQGPQDEMLKEIFHKKKIDVTEQWQVVKLAMELEKKKKPFLKKTVEQNDNGDVVVSKKMIHRAIRQHKRNKKPGRFKDLKFELIWIKVILLLILIYILSTFVFH